MKFRKGFVSNSSSSSFLILGFSGIDNELFKDLSHEYWHNGIEDECFCQDADEYGNCFGVYAEPYLEKDKLENAKIAAYNDIKDMNMPCELKDKLLTNYKIDLIYDSYYS